MTVRDHTGAGVVIQSQTPRRLMSDRRPDELHTAGWNPARGNLLNHLFFFPPSSVSGDQESCRHSVDSQGSGGVPRKQMRLDHFAAAAQQLDCGFDRHPYPPDSFGSASSSKTEQVTHVQTRGSDVLALLHP